MSVFLTKDEVDSYSEYIKEEFDQLLSRPNFAALANAKQWSFFRHCFDVLLGQAAGDFPGDKQTIAQYKFEVTDRLRRYYLAPGNPTRFVFQLVHKKDANAYGLDESMYPSSNMYLLLVAPNETFKMPAHEARGILERTVADAIDAEWAVYVQLPEIDLTPLEGVFAKDGSAYKDILIRAEHAHKDKRTISNSLNPSTRRLIDVRVRKILSTEAEVHAKEYWYLKWWSIDENMYVYTYKEIGWQYYFLTLKDSCWLVVDNPYPLPKTSSLRRSRISKRKHK